MAKKTVKSGSLSFGRLTAKAAGVAADAVGEFISDQVYPETEYGFAALLFERISQNERDQVQADREYCLNLARECLDAVRESPPSNDS